MFFILDVGEDLNPEWLNFRVVDSEDLLVNSSRETLHQHRILCVVKKHLLKNCLDPFV